MVLSISMKGVIDLICRIGLTSDTIAHKAQRILTAAGYHCELIRIQGSQAEGCSFGIRAAGNCEAVRTVLENAGIRPRSTETESGGI